MTPILASSWFLVPAAVAAASLAVLVLALRGRRVGDHPICRKCGFDLFGKPEGSARCSECGADLSSRRAVWVGRRRVRRRMAAAAGVALVVSAGAAGVVGWAGAKGVEANRYKPAWWLTREANARGPATRDAALAELARRIAAGTLPRDREAALVEQALAVQADESRPWAPGWGSVVEAARAAGRVSDGQWRRYCFYGMGVDVDRSKVLFRRHAEYGLGIGRTAGRTATPPGQSLWPADFAVGIFADGPATADGRQKAVDGGIYASGYRDQLVPAAGSGISAADPADNPDPDFASVVAARDDDAGSIMLHFPHDPSADRTRTYVPPKYKSLDDGPHAVRFPWVLRPLRIDPATGRWEVDPAGPPARAVAVTATWTILPVPRLNADPALKAAVEQSVAVDNLIYRWKRGTPGGGESAALLSYRLAVRGPPVALAFDVYLRPAGRSDEWQLPREVSCGRGKTVGPYMDQSPVYRPRDDGPPRIVTGELDVRTVDVVLRPNPQAAPDAADVTAVWGGEVVIRDVPIRAGN